jgi:hypothetical protein
MQATRQHFLAGAGFAQQQHRGIAGRNLFDGAADLEHFRVAGDQALQGFGTRALHQNAVFLFQFIDRKARAMTSFEDLFLEKACDRNRRRPG